MLTLFRTNQLLFSFLLLFYAGALHVTAFINPIDWQPAGYGVFSAWVYQAIGANGMVPNIVTIALIFLQGTFINFMVAEHRLSDTVSLFPGLFFILISSLLPTFQHLSPLHMANTFYLIALSALLKVYKKPDAADTIFNAGFWAAIGSLFYPSYLVFVILGLIGLNSLRAFNVKEWLMLLIGALVPYLLLGVYFFWKDQLADFLDTQFVNDFAFLDFKHYANNEIYFQIAFYDLFLLIAIFSYSLYVFKKVMQVQKKIGLLYWGLFVGGTTLLFQADIQIDHLLIIAVPLGILISLNFQAIANRWAETFHWLILAIVLFFQYQQFLLPT